MRTAPEPWTGEDVVAWQKTMAWQLSANWRDELLRLQLAVRLGDEGAGLLMPADTPGGPVILPPDGVLRSQPLGTGGPAVTAPAGVAPGVASDVAALSAIVDTLDVAPPFDGGSNNWVVAGSRSITGKPLLANDPHLAGQAPAVWYLAHVSGGTLDAIGATLPGVPGVMIGRNQRIAWGITALLGDVQDLYVEKVNTRDQAEFNGALEPVRIVRETIKVRGEPDVPLRVRITRHGPIISDVLEHPQSTLALRWTGLDPDDATAECFVRVNLAGSWPAFTEALRRMKVPLLNFVYADVDGNIGYYGPGAFPVRAAGDGTRPVPGWTGEFEWRGYLHESEWPSAYNPPRGYIVSANNKVAPDSFPFMLGSSWEAPYRAARIVEMIEQTSKLAVEDMGRMQRDLRSAQVKVVLPFLLKARPLDTPGRDAMDFLREWDGTLDGESPQAALYEAWYDGHGARPLRGRPRRGPRRRVHGAAQPGGEGRRQPDPVRRQHVVRRRADAGGGDVRDAARADAAARAGRHERPAGHVEPLEVAMGSGERRAVPASSARRRCRCSAASSAGSFRAAATRSPSRR